MKRRSLPRAAKMPVAQKRLPEAGMRTWLQLTEVTETGWSGVLILVFHWHGMASLEPIDAAIKGTKDRRNWWRATAVGDERQVPQISVAYSAVTDIFERDLFVRPSSGESPPYPLRFVLARVQ